MITRNILTIIEVYAESITFISDNIKIFENGNLIHAFNGKALDEKEQIEVECNKSIYDKSKAKLTIIDNVKFFPSLNS